MFNICSKLRLHTMYTYQMLHLCTISTQERMSYGAEGAWLCSSASFSLFSFPLIQAFFSHVSSLVKVEWPIKPPLHLGCLK
jgi:hypothetical protein